MVLATLVGAWIGILVGIIVSPSINIPLKLESIEPVLNAFGTRTAGAMD